MVALVSPQPSVCRVLLLTNTLQCKGSIFGAESCLKGFPSAPGQEGYLADFALGTGKSFTRPEEVEAV